MALIKKPRLIYCFESPLIAFVAYALGLKVRLFDWRRRLLSRKSGRKLSPTWMHLGYVGNLMASMATVGFLTGPSDQSIGKVNRDPI